MPAATQTLSRLKASADARHLMRYLKFKANVSLAEIAKQEHVSLKTVQESIKEIERDEARNSPERLQLAMRDLVISAVPQAKETLNMLLTATNTVERKNKNTGLVELVGDPDKVTRLEAMRIVKGLMEVMTPKVPMIQNTLTQTNQTAVLSNAETVEERMRRLRAKQAEHNLLPPVTVAVPEFIDKGLKPDDYGEDDEDDEEE